MPVLAAGQTQCVPVVVLAAGASRRMRGRDKLFELVDGTPLLRRQVSMAIETGQPVFVALPDPGHPRAAMLVGLNVTVLPVPQSGDGLSATLRSVVEQLPPCRGFMILLADLVEITVDDLRAVLAARITRPDHLIWRGATQDNKPGHPVIFDFVLRPQFLDLHGDQGAEPIARAYQQQTCLVPLPGQHARLDLDTPEEWENWRKL